VKFRAVHQMGEPNSLQPQLQNESLIHSACRGPEAYASGGYTSLDQPRIGGLMSGNNLHAIRADERVARLYELVNYAPKLQLRVRIPAS